jgi:5-(hydroxymethyl)furfural/furfural oxidase
MEATHVVIGGGSAGCVLAARLSERRANNVVLIEAGADFTPEQTPTDILDTYAGRALGNPQYFWSGFTVKRGTNELLGDDARRPIRFEQARVIGGGSSINGQVALRGIPEDFERWNELGAEGWDWNGVLPYFRKLETDTDFTDQMHGSSGPIPIKRFFKPDWDNFTLSVADMWEQNGYRYSTDMNGEFEDGYFPIPLSNDGRARVSTAVGYLTTQVRQRPNLKIISRTEAQRLIFEGTKAVGVEVEDQHRNISIVRGHKFIIAAGVFRSPFLLMKSGIGPADELRNGNVPVLVDRRGVGKNLQDHPLISISAFLLPVTRARAAERRNFAYLRFSSGVEGCPPSDMIMMAVCKSSWHAVGSRIGTLSANLAHAFSRGTVRLGEAGARHPDVDVNWLSDGRDRIRIMAVFERMAEILRTKSVSRYAVDPFASSFSGRARIIQKATFKNAALTQIGALAMDNSSILRKLLIDKIIRQSPPLQELLDDRKALETYVCENIGTTFHPVGTCRMGNASDPNCVVDPKGLVIGTANVHVADASIMPEITRTNTNIPTIMIAERMADLVA